ncbi:MAG: hypothetical protein ACK40Q_09920 [Pseudothermotoga sp.]
MDIKHPWESYHEAIGVNYDIERLKKTISLIKESGKHHQFRTTLIPGLSKEKILAIAKEMDIEITFQTYRDPFLWNDPNLFFLEKETLTKKNPPPQGGGKPTVGLEPTTY